MSRNFDRLFQRLPRHAAAFVLREASPFKSMHETAAISDTVN